MAKPKVFISHSTADQDNFVNALAVDLEKAGAHVFYSNWALKPGDRIRDKVSQAIATCEYFIIVLSARSVKSKWVRIELDQAMILELQGKGLVIIPILIGRLTNEDIPKDIAGLLWIDFRYRRDRYKTGLTKLHKTIGLHSNKLLSFETSDENDKLLPNSQIKQYHRTDPLAWNSDISKRSNSASINLDYHLNRPFSAGPKEALIELCNIILANLNQIANSEASRSASSSVKEAVFDLLQQEKIDNSTAVALMNLDNQVNLALKETRLTGTRARTIILDAAHIMDLIQTT